MLTTEEAIETLKSAGQVEIEGGQIHCFLPRPQSPRVEAAIAVMRQRKREALELLAEGERSIGTKPPKEEFICPAEWEARELNRIFEDHGTGATVRPFRVEDIENWRLRLQWTQRWPGKPFAQLRMGDGSIDSAVGTWVSEQLRRAGTRFLRVEGRNSLAVWPEQAGSEYRLALRLADLDHLQIYSRDDPRIQSLLEPQHSGRP